MPKHTNPNSPSPPGDDDDLSLGAAEGRDFMRPRLPDQRREVRQFETPGPLSPTAERPHDFAATHVSQPRPDLAAPGIIETYDPARPEPPVARTENIQSEAAAQRHKPNADLDDLEDFIARTAGENPENAPPANIRRPLTMVEKVCSGSGALILLVLAIWLVRSVTAVSQSVPPVSSRFPDLPLKGELITISDATANWRARTPTDRVAQMEVILPVPRQQEPEYMPQISFTIDSSASKSGFLRFIFRDSVNQPRGDTRVVQIQGGQLRDMGKGEIIKGSTEGSVYCSEGLPSLLAMHAYAYDHMPRWNVEVAESADYGASGKDWKILGTFDVRNDIAK